MIYKQVKYPWGNSWITYDSWNFKEISITKKIGDLGEVSWEENVVKDETVTEQGEYVLSSGLMCLIKEHFGKVHKIVEYNSNCFDVIESESEKKRFLKSGHLSMNQNTINTMNEVGQCLKFLEDAGWSELIDSRFENEVRELLEKYIPNVTKETIEKTIELVIV